MEIRATGMKLRRGTTIEMSFEDGIVKKLDLSTVYDQMPELKPLSDRNLFVSGKLYSYIVVWNDDIDIGTDTIYELGETIRKSKTPVNAQLASAVYAARVRAQMTRAELSQKSGIDLANLSRIEAGTANPSVATLRRIGEALGSELKITFG